MGLESTVHCDAAESGSGVSGDAESSCFLASFAQTRVWFVSQLEPDSASYHLPFGLRFHGELDRQALRSAIEDLVARHEALRTDFALDHEELTQVIHATVALPILEVDLRDTPPEDRERRLAELAEAHAREAFDLRRAPLARFSLFRCGEQEHVLTGVMHHSISDGWSVGVLLGDLAVLYARRRGLPANPLPKLRVQYADYAVWQRERLSGTALARRLDFWKEQLAGAPQVLALPCDHVPVAGAPVSSGRVRARLAPGICESLKNLARAEAATPFMVLLAVFGSLLGRLAGEEEVVVGTPMSSRSRVELEAVIGLFLNTLPLRCRLAGAPSLRELLRRLRRTTLDVYEQQDFPFEKLVEELHPERSTRHTPLFQVFLNLVPPPAFDASWPDLKVEPFLVDLVVAKFDLTLYVEFEHEEPQLELMFRSDVFSAARMEEFLRQFVQLLDQATRAPDEPLGNLSLVTPETRSTLPDPTKPIPAGTRPSSESGDAAGVLTEGFERQAALRPERVAIEDGWGSWAYGELELRSNQLAHELAAAGLGRGDWVAIYAVRGGAMVCAILAVLKAGAAWIILDAAYPSAVLVRRINRVRPSGFLAIAGAGIPPPEIVAALDELGTRVRFSVPDTVHANAWPGVGRPSGPPRASHDPNQPAYAVFTSGTTGEPGLVVTTHRPVCHFLAWQISRFALNSEDRFSQLAGLGHDPLLRDIFAPLWCGAPLCIPPPDEADVGRWFQRERIGVAHLTPSLGRVLMDSAPGAPELRLAFFGGDVLRRRDVGRLRQWAPRAVSVNFYGATETPQAMGCAVVPAAWNEAESNEVMALGQGIDDAQLVVINAAGQLAGLGELGEIHIRTPYLSEGYWGDPERTRLHFQTNPFTRQETDRLYRTGDLGRYGPRGEVEFAGRADLQVKVRGQRVELATVEAALEGLPAVQRAAVVVSPDSNGDGTLVGFVVPRGGPLDAAGLRSALATRLQPFEVPSRWLSVEELPLNRHGKVDRRALMTRAATSEITTASTADTPQTELERRIASIWAGLLQSESIDRHADFFAAGGHSLLALRLISRLNDEFGARLSLRTLFDARTVAEMARVLEACAQPAPTTRSRPTLWGAATGVPFIMVPGYFGLGYLRGSLASEVGEVCPYCDSLRYAGVDDEQPAHRTIEDIASHLIQQMSDLVPAALERVCLAGFSFGGLVAFEMAQQLRRRGCQVRQLFLYDSRLPHDFRVRSHGEVFWELLRRARRQPQGQRAGFLRFMVDAKVRAVWGSLKRRLVPDPVRGQPTSAAAGAPASSLPGDVSPAVGDAGLLKESVRLASIRAASRYRPKPYDGRVVLFKATEEVANEWLRLELDRLNGWGPYVPNGLELVLVPRNHLGIYTEPLHPVVISRTLALLQAVQVKSTSTA